MENTIDSLLKKITEVTYYEMDWHTFEDLVKIVYGHEFEFVADRECGNDSEHTFSVNGNLDEYQVGYLNLFKETGEYSFMSGTLLNALVSLGILKPGMYLINVSW
jgi:hypothetical protein